MYLHRSNRTEALVAELRQLVEEDPLGPFEAEVIVVQGKGMERWLSMELARQIGVWARAEFPFPRRLLEQAFDAALGETRPDAPAPFEPQVLTWTLCALISELREREELGPLARYLRDGSDGDRLVQLAERIADTFDHYVVYRPDMIRDWEAGRDDVPGDQRWQPLLWRALVARHGREHLGARFERGLRALAAGKGPVAGLPRRVSVFGVSSLPPIYVQALDALSRRIDVHLFVLCPSRQYWADLRKRKHVLRDAAARGLGRDATVELLKSDSPVRLLASLGQVGADLQYLLEQVEYVDDDGGFVEPERDDALATLQADILDLAARKGAEAELADDDHSIRMHACHGPMREVEVLHDQLVGILAAHPELRPDQVIVMTPSIETYAPYIEAVFGAGGQRMRLPYRVADQGPRATLAVLEALEAVLEVATSRFAAPDVLDLVHVDLVRRRFGIDAGDFETVRDWVVQAGIRWGADAEHRAEVGQPPLPGHTWRLGLDRLLLGFAMPQVARFAGVAPHAAIGDGAGALLGKFVDLVDRLDRWRRRLAAPRPLEAWARDLSELLGEMVAEGDDAGWEHQLVRDALVELATQAARGGFAGDVELATVRRHLDDVLAARATPHGFLARGITFCELVPMRSVPFPVVCLLGMNDDAFPRSDRPLGFDLMAHKRRRGDRSRRDDDRYLFLEALLSARQQLVVTYTGRSVQDDSELPPSVLVGELLDVLGETFGLPDTQARERFVVEHPLQPFSPRYFDGSDDRLWSHVAMHAVGAQTAREERHSTPPFLTAAMPEEPLTELPLTQLVNWFRKPTEELLKRRFRLYLGQDRDAVPGREPLSLNGLEDWKVRDEIVRGLTSARNPDEIREELDGRGWLPPGSIGGAAYGKSVGGSEELVAQVLAHRGDAALPPVRLDLVVDGVRLVGQLADRWSNGRLRWQAGSLKEYQRLGAWIEHLALCAMGVEAPAVLVTREHVLHLPPCDRPRELLQELLAIYRAGMRMPLPLFPDASGTYADCIGDGEAHADALKKARKQFEPTEGPEAQDPYVRQAFGGSDPLADDYRPPFAAAEGWRSFRELAVVVFGPIPDAEKHS